MGRRRGERTAERREDWGRPREDRRNIRGTPMREIKALGRRGEEFEKTSGYLYDVRRVRTMPRRKELRDTNELRREGEGDEPPRTSRAAAASSCEEVCRRVVVDCLIGCLIIDSTKSLEGEDDDEGEER